MQTKLWKCYGSCMDLNGGDSYYLFIKLTIVIYEIINVVYNILFLLLCNLFIKCVMLFIYKTMILTLFDHKIMVKNKQTCFVFLLFRKLQKLSASYFFNLKKIATHYQSSSRYSDECNRRTRRTWNMYFHMQAVLLCKWNTCLFRDGTVGPTCTVTWHGTFLNFLRCNMKLFTCRSNDAHHIKSFHQCVVMQYSIHKIRKTHIIDNIWIIYIFFYQYTFWNEYSTFLLLYLPSCTDLFLSLLQWIVGLPSVQLIQAMLL